MFSLPQYNTWIEMNWFVNQEKVKVKDIIESRKNDKVQYALEHCYEIMCEGEPFELSEFGTPEMIDAVTNEAIASPKTVNNVEYNVMYTEKAISIDGYNCSNPNMMIKVIEENGNFNFYYNTINPERNFSSSSIKSEENVFILEDYKCSFKYENEYLVFDFFEKQFGSSLTLLFNNNFNNHNLQQKLLLRDVLVANAKFNYFKTGYLGFNWNLHNQTTDTIVDLSRDNLTYMGKQWISDALLNNILPKALKLISSIFIQEIDKKHSNQDHSLDGQYLNYCLSAFACKLEDFNHSSLSRITIPHEFVSCNRSMISADKLFGATDIILVKDFKKNTLDTILEEEIERIENQYQDILANNIVFWGDDYLYNAYLYNYDCSEIVIYNKDCKFAT